MAVSTHKRTTYLGLFRKYKGNIKKATPEELKAAQELGDVSKHLYPLYTAARQYEEELDRRYRCQGAIPAVCVDREGYCDEDCCRCWN